MNSFSTEDNVPVPDISIVKKEDPLFIKEDFQHIQSPIEGSESNVKPTFSADMLGSVHETCSDEQSIAAARESNKLTTAACRMCLTQASSHLRPLFKTVKSMGIDLHENTDVASKIAFVAPTIRKVKEDDGYPQFICLTCIAKLDVTFGFLRTAVACDKLTNEFCPQPNGILLRKTSLKPQILIQQHVQLTDICSKRRTFRHKAYVSKDLTEGTVENMRSKLRRRQCVIRLKKRKYKRRYATKILLQKKIRNKRKVAKEHKASSLRYTTEVPESLCSKRKRVQLSSSPVVKLYVNNILYCIKCKRQNVNGVCSDCGPISELLLRCRGCRRNFRNPLSDTKLKYLCLKCHEDFMNCCTMG